MIILGIDPGTRDTGFGCIQSKGNQFTCRSAGSLKAPESPMPPRLATMYGEFESLLEEQEPDLVVVEEAFYGPNAKASMKLGQVRGVILLGAQRADVEIAEYTPKEIKKATTGNGSASKHQVKRMVLSLLNLAGESLSKHATDALAAAICGAHRSARRS